MTWEHILKMSDDLIEELNAYIKKADSMFSELHDMTEAILDKSVDIELIEILQDDMGRGLDFAMEVMADLSKYRHELYDSNKALQEDLE